MNIPSIKFVFDRKHKADDNTKGTIDLRITYNYKQKFISTKISCYPGQWDSKNECINRKCTEADALNALLLQIRTKVLNIVTKMAADGNIDINSIQNRLKNNAVDITFEKYIYKRMKEKPVSDNTRRAYNVFYTRFSAWGKMECFDDISEHSIRAWDEYLHTFTWKELDRYGNEVEKKYSQATIGAMHKNLKAFINDAMIDGYVRENPYSSKRIKIEKGSARTEQFLTLEEIKKIETTEMPTRSLEEAKDLFLFACKTALSFADLMEFDYSKIVEVEGIKLYKGKRHKTAISFSSVITNSALSILEKYKHKLPKVPNQKYNVKLKLIADAAGIDKPISSHWARRSAAMIWLNEGVPIEVVSKILGHTNTAQTLEYAHVLDKTIIKEIKKVAGD